MIARAAVSRFGRAGLVASAHVLSIPIYFAYAGVLKAVNAGRRREPLARDVQDLMAPHFPDLELGAVRLVHPAVIPSARPSTSGLTIGHTIHLKVAPDAGDLRAMRLLLHELVHVRQNVRLGATGFARAYGVEWARHLSYRDNPLEAEAFAYEAERRPVLTAAVAAVRTGGARTRG